MVIGIGPKRKAGHGLVFMPPDVAGPVGAEGWSKQDASDLCKACIWKFR
ncbi:MAG: hypothetical protein CM1200mP38_7870 [Dehalococcoidia bacterium]|nr:MAG: hypothetical protein CM1200mP38_7870 [Dehalococcoidia bacterium]